MRIGYGIDTSRGGEPMANVGPDERLRIIEEIIEEGILAERAGFHSIRVPDRHGREDCYFPGSLQWLTLLARETERVALGAFALGTIGYHPMLIAEQCAVIDHLSHGRLFMTLARGDDALRYFGVPDQRKVPHFLENLEVLERANGGGRFSFHGEFNELDDELLALNTYQQPRYPIWGGAKVGPAIVRCARFAEAWACDDVPFDWNLWRIDAGDYRNSARALGKEPFIVLSRNAWLADSFESAMDEFGNRYIAHLQSMAARGRLRHVPAIDEPGKVTPKSILPHAIMGNAPQCIEQLEQLQEELGVDYLTMRFRLPGGPDSASVQRQIARFGQEVLPHFHDRTAATIHPALPVSSRW